MIKPLEDVKSFDHPHLVFQAVKLGMRGPKRRDTAKGINKFFDILLKARDPTLMSTS